jgi:peptidyl-prolyl cis-trans isomerase C
MSYCQTSLSSKCSLLGGEYVGGYSLVEMSLQVPIVARDAVSEPQRARARARIGFVVGEPFLQFIALGLLVWGAVEYWHANSNSYTIDIGPTERERIAMSYLRQFGQRPTQPQLQGLIDRHIREEIFLREGLALNLDKDDEIVRRRVVQKYEFLQTDLAVPEPPPPRILERWFAQNKVRYLAPERVAFSQVYFSVEGRGEQVAKSRAVKNLEKIRGMGVSRAPDFGDAFPGPADVAGVSQEEARRLFGESDLSQALFDNPPVGQWVGPYRSGYGWHLIFVTGIWPPMLPALADIHERVLTDYLDEERRLVNERAFEKLRAKYKVRYDGAGEQIVSAGRHVIPDQSETE